MVTSILLLSTVVLIEARDFLPGHAQAAENWEKIGEQKINIQADTDEVTLSGGHPLLAFKVKSRKGGINLHRCTIVFRDGSKKTVELRNDIPPGGESRTIPLMGQQSEVVKIIFWFDTKQYGQPVELEIWGKR
jgi:hypothetical protein